jgi:hypothetical protein
MMLRLIFDDSPITNGAHATLDFDDTLYMDGSPVARSHLTVISGTVDLRQMWVDGNGSILCGGFITGDADTPYANLPIEFTNAVATVKPMTVYKSVGGLMPATA